MFRPYISNETVLFPECIGDFIPQDSPVRFISDIIDRMNLGELIESYGKSDEGNKPYNPVMLLKVTIYGYFNNVFSTRGLEDVMTRDLHMIWLSSKQFPDHCTISRFKTRCLPYIKDLFAQLVRILVEKGEITLSKELYIDGTTIRSRAARRRIKWRSNAEKFSVLAEAELQEALRDLMSQAEEGAENQATVNTHVDLTPQDAILLAEEIESKMAGNPKKGIKTKIKRVRDAAQRKQAHDRTLRACKGRCGVAPTDPDCGIMHAKEDGYAGQPTPNYNVQIATQNQYVTNYDVFDNAADKATALDFVETCVEENGVKPEAVVEDAGYGCEEVYVGLARMQIEAVVKYQNYDRQRKSGKIADGSYHKDRFRLSPDGNGLLCPADRELRTVKVETSVSHRGFKSDVTRFTCDHCQGCRFYEKCDLSNSADKIISRKMGNLREERKAMERLGKPLNRERLRRRCLEPEPVFGQLKHNHGYTRFRHFSKPKVRMDLGFELMALNLLKLYRNMKISR